MANIMKYIIWDSIIEGSTDQTRKQVTRSIYWESIGEMLKIRWDIWLAIYNQIKSEAENNTNQYH